MPVLARRLPGRAQFAVRALLVRLVVAGGIAVAFVLASGTPLRAGHAEPVDVSIVLYPGSGPAIPYVDPSSDGSVPVAILSAPGFAAATVDAATVTLAGAPVTKGRDGVLSRLEDVNGDGLPDLVVRVVEREIGIEDDAEGVAILLARAADGRFVRGRAVLRAIEPPEALARRFEREGPSRTATPRKVAIDVLPRESDNLVDLGTSGSVPVAILSEPQFDATSVEPTTLHLGGARVTHGADGALAVRDDVNGDGLADLVVRVQRSFPRAREGLQSVTLRAGTEDGTVIEGSDLVRFVNLPSRANRAAAPVIEAAAVEASSPLAITIRDLATASPFPSVLNVSGLSGAIAKVRVTLHGITHPYATDLDVLLVGPGGRAVTILSDAGGSTPLDDTTITFDDDAPAPIEFLGPVASATYQPTNFFTGDAFQPPAPTPGPVKTLSAFQGTDPNGTWQLYVQDDFSQGAGTIARGWSLEIVLAKSACAGGAIIIPSAGAASPNPASVAVSGLAGMVVSSLSVTLKDFTHLAPADVDILLVGPGGQTAILLSDVGSLGPADGVTLTLDDHAKSPLPVSGVLSSGTFRPTDAPPADSFAAPAPFHSGNTRLSIFNGTNPNGTWSLYVMDDSAGSSGAIAGGFCLTLTLVAPSSSCNPTFVTIQDAGPAAPYPSQITVAGALGVVAKATVTLNGFSHTFPDDVDVLLQGPTGAETILMSDAGGGAPGVSDATITFDDTAAGTIPDTGPIATGSYRPADYEPGDSFPPPAPAPSGSAALSVFNGKDPNGTWALHLVDDRAGDSGGLARGWCLNLTLVVPPSAGGCNFGPISISSAGSATPYPSVIPIAGVSAPVSKARVRLFGFSHSRPTDVDVLLVGPSGGNLLLFSDQGGSAEVAHADLVFDDDAGAPIPAAGPLISGTYRPGNVGGGDVFVAPAPPPSGSTGLSVFDGIDPNGAWSLWVMDGVSDEEGGIAGGWCIEVLPSFPPFEPDGLRWSAGSAKDSLVWRQAENATEYRVYVGRSEDLPRLLDSAEDACGKAVVAVTAVDGVTETPAAGSFYWVLVRGANGGGESPPGNARIGGAIAPRIQDTYVADCPLCSHRKCDAGDPLLAYCGTCEESICAADPACCSSTWDAGCIAQVRTVCASLSCPDSAGSCAHGPCVAGAPLVSGCDNPPVSPGCVAAICADDPACCATEWDPICMAEVETICGFSCE